MIPLHTTPTFLLVLILLLSHLPSAESRVPEPLTLPLAQRCKTDPGLPPCTQYYEDCLNQLISFVDQEDTAMSEECRVLLGDEGTEEKKEGEKRGEAKDQPKVEL